VTYKLIWAVVRQTNMRWYIRYYELQGTSWLCGTSPHERGKRNEGCLEQGVCLDYSRMISEGLEPFSTSSIRPACSGTVLWTYKKAHGPDAAGVQITRTLLWKSRSTASRGRWPIGWTIGETKSGARHWNPWRERTSHLRRWQSGWCDPLRLRPPYTCRED
jgi:hypothetical protein